MSFFCIRCGVDCDPRLEACPRCREPFTDFLRRYIESPIDGKYKILSRLGIGGMGEVYKVLHLHLNSIRVVKLMRPNLAGERSAHARFLREARLATRIRHPNVAALFDFSAMDDDSYYMVWEHIEGTNLANLLRAGGFLSPRYAVEIAIGVLDGLEAIHRAGIIHRDISPENIMLATNDRGDETVKIIDLGIAKQAGDESRDQTLKGVFVGKWRYCSPEQSGFLDDGERIDSRSDLYSVGAVLYEMVTGAPPFVGDTPHAYMQFHSTQQFRPLREVNPRLGEVDALEDVIFRALVRKPKDRIATARLLSEALKAILPDLPAAPGVTAEDHKAGRLAEETIEEELPASLADPTIPDTLIPVPPTIVAEIRSNSFSGGTETFTMPLSPGDKELIGMGGEQSSSGTSPLTLSSAGVSRWLPAIIVAVLLVSAALAVFLKTVPHAAEEVASQAPPLALGAVGVHAFPWGEIVDVRDLASGRKLNRDGQLTPARLELPPGRYQITVFASVTGSEEKKNVTVAAGGQQIISFVFSDPAATVANLFEADSP
jgi:eukaryotic-like serine/threonine-protein kinase